MPKTSAQHNGWREVKLGDFVEINKKSINKNYRFEKIKYLDTGSITCGKIESFQIFDLKQAPSRAKRLVSESDIIYSTVRPIQRHYGFIKKPEDNLVVSTGFAVISAIPQKLDPKYLYYFLTTDEVVDYLDSIAEASTSAYPSLRPDDLEKLDIFLPPLPEQKAIAEVLSPLDAKITLLHHQNQTLESLAQTLFKKWFIQDADGEWKKVKLREICSINNGYAFKSPTYQSDGQKIIRTLNFKNNFIELNNLVFISRNLAEIFNKYYLKRKDFLLVMVGASIGNFAIVTSDVLPALQNQNMWCFRAKENISQHYLNFTLRKLILDNVHVSSGSARDFYQKSVFYEYEIVQPSIERMNKFDEVSENYFSKIEMNKTQIHNLEKFRNILLPKLINGSIKVKEK